MRAPKEVEDLVKNFEANVEACKPKKYNINETQLRVEYVNPFFEALGWDVRNESGLPQSYRDVRHEYTLKTSEGTKAPDYCFYIGGEKKFFLETKRPSVHIKDDIAPAFQLRCYGWTGELPLSILTDFEEFAVYDCRIKPQYNDRASVGRIEYFKYTEYLAQWDYLYGIFSKEAIQKGSLDSYIASDKRKKGTITVDQSFLEDMEGWRDLLARNIALRNPNLTVKELNHLVQATIDRIVFLRICEDREIESPGRLQNLLKSERLYAELCKLFEQADKKYNSGLFHFKEEKGRGRADALSLKLSIDNKPLNEIIRKLYYPNPYIFSQIPAEILGRVYEKFLGKVIRLTPSHKAKVELKPEVRKAGGVYYTPKYIVDYIVKNTVGELLKKKSPGQAKKLKIIDPACGSGSFLIGAYQYLLDWYTAEYAKDASKHKRLIYKDARDEWRLSTAEKKEILLNNIYGVDIDRQAVEVTKLSLLLKVLENENKDTLDNQVRLFHERALPDLSTNIKCGNSLIGTDFFSGKNLELFGRDEMENINAFDWDGKEGFPEIMKAGGFDAVIGNPPYGRYTNIAVPIKDYLKKENLYGKTSDLAEFFIQKMTNLVRKQGSFSFIVPKGLTYVKSWHETRKLLTEKFRPMGFIDTSKSFQDVKYEMVIFNVKNQKSNPDIQIKVGQVRNNIVNEVRVSNFFVNENIILTISDMNILSLYEKMKTCSQPASMYYNYWYGKGGLTPLVNKEHRGIQLLTGKEISRYSVNERERWYIEEKFLSMEDISKNSVNKTVVQDIVAHIKNPRPHIKLMATIDKKKLFCLNTVMCFSQKDKKFRNEFLCGLINSKLISFFYYMFIFNQAIRTMHFMPGYSDILPIPTKNITTTKHDRMVQLVDQILDTQKNSMPASQSRIESTFSRGLIF